MREDFDNRLPIGAPPLQSHADPRQIFKRLGKVCFPDSRQHAIYIYIDRERERESFVYRGSDSFENRLENKRGTVVRIHRLVVVVVVHRLSPVKFNKNRNDLRFRPGKPSVLNV